LAEVKGVEFMATFKVEPRQNGVILDARGPTQNLRLGLFLGLLLMEFLINLPFRISFQK
jgi:hypothetical protein